MRGKLGQTDMTLAAAVLCVLVSAVAVEGAFGSDPVRVMTGTTGETWSRGSARQVGEWFAGTSDLVFVGRFISWERDSVAPYQGHRVECQIDSVLMGRSPGPVVLFRRLVEPSFAAGRLRRGTRVLVRLTRLCTLERESCGDFQIISESGELLSDHISENLLTEKGLDDRALRLSDLPGDLFRARDLETHLRSAECLAHSFLVRVDLHEKGSSLWRVVNPTVIAGTSVDLPEFVRFRRLGGCHTDFSATSFLLPIPRGFKGDTLEVDYCSRALVVKDDEVLAMGVRLGTFAKQLQFSPQGGLELPKPSSGDSTRMK